MYLKSLELQGFKSFPDKIKLEFGKGMTAVVGPNGSGKSNIGDAVRWVLGEQSSKTLRGAKMEDVIFAGTQYRKAVGFASVTLNIVNDKGLLSIDEPEVSVTRKLYRSGESEYLINGRQVRLKDILELFMDTGLGRDGYSIIGQGRVAEIVSAKSAERREIFEEAAGISKFRYRRAEAERRLAAAEENLVRLRDILSELEGRVEPLRIQSEKAQKFITLSEEKKSLEISVWMKRLDELKENLDELNEKLLISKAGHENTSAELNRTETEAAEFFRGMQEATAKIEQLRSRLLEAEQENQQLHSDIAVFENDISHCNAAIEEIEEIRKNSENVNRENERLMTEKLAEIDEIKRKIEECTEGAAKAEEDFRRLIGEQESFSKDFEAAGAELNKLYIRQSELKVSLAAGETSLDDIKASIVRAAENEEQQRVAAEELVQERAEITEGIKLLEERADEQSNRLNGLERLYKGKAEKLSAAEKELSDISFAIREKQQRINLLSDLENSMEGFAHSVKTVIKAGQSGRIGGIRGSVAQLVSTDPEYSLAIETALGGAMQNIIVDNEETAKRCIRFLQESKAGRATFLPITSVRGNVLRENGLENCDGFIAIASELAEYDDEYKGIFASLLGRIVIAEDIDLAALIAKKYGYKFKIVTLDGQVINAGGSFTGGSSNRSNGMLSRKNEIETLTAEAEKLAEKQRTAQAQADKLRSETDKLKIDTEDAREQLQVISNDRVRFEAEIRRIDGVSEQTKNASEFAAEQSRLLKEKLSEQEKTLKIESEELEKISSEISEKESEVSVGREKNDEFAAERDKLSNLISEMKLSKIALEKDEQAAQDAVEQIKRNAEKLNDDSANQLLRIKMQEKIIEEKRALIEERKQALAAAGDNALKINEQISQLRDKHSEFERKTNENRIKTSELNSTRESYATEITRLEERCASVRKTEDGIISEMLEQYNISRSEAAEIAEPVEDMLIAQRDLNDVKQKIRSLGHVNVAAIEEYKEVSERYEFMSGQIKDVEVSKKEIERLIEELTENMKKQFSESFEAINTNFKQIFVELFGGGRAELTLTDPEDVLESGIEINVAPPGKVIKNLSLLSGGEQAFVAIAIYFAILKIKPAPFCILDEIEAALDDVNVTKYAQYLSNFYDTTQFIVVTHRRGTMEEADILYGVTMQEKGISRLLRMEQPPADIEAE
ncbi:MAG: chromosome segregation protein SMC [Oscillospiraceae bacterium]|nr:chromosome segregation protein SMC [Oscillospiraceae bacterium]